MAQRTPSRLLSWGFSDARATTKSADTTTIHGRETRRRRSFGDLLRRLSGTPFAAASAGRDVGNCKALRMEELPEDILLQIVDNLDIGSILKVATVCRILHDIVDDRAVWRCKASQLMASGRPLVLPGFLTLEEISSNELKAAVMRTVKLAARWTAGSSDLTPKPEPPPRLRPFSLTGRRSSGEVKKQTTSKPLRSLHSERIRLDINVSHCLCYIVKFKHFLLPPTRDGKLIGFDINSKRHVGEFDMTRTSHRASTTNNDGQGNTNTPTRNRSSGLIFSGRVHYATRSLYYIVSAGFVSGQEMRFYVLHIRFPPDNDPKGCIRYTRVASLVLPYAYIIEMHILDVTRRMLCMVLLCPSSKTLCLYVVFDWDTKESAIINTGLGYQYRKTVISLRLSSDEDSVILRSEKDGHDVQRVYSLANLSPGSLSYVLRTGTTSDLTRASLSSQPITAPLQESKTWTDGVSRSPSLPFPGPNHNAGNFTESFAYRVWNMLPWWPTFSVPYRTSTVVLYWTPHPAIGEHRWKIAQHFATDAGPCPISNPSAFNGEARSASSSKSSSSRASSESTTSTLKDAKARYPFGSVERRVVYKRCIVPLRDPVLVPNSEDSVPILGLAYNHVGWIEQVHTSRRGRRIKTRVAMLASFPDPDSCTDPSSRTTGSDENHKGLKASTRVLDIPERVLDDAYHLIVDSSSATVSLTTCGNEMYTYRYA